MLLKAENLFVSLNRRPILRGVGLQVHEGEIVSLLGGNASGKTTTLKAILGLLPVEKGRVWVGDEDVTARRPDFIVKRGVAIVPENRRLFPEMTIEENLRLVLHRSQSKRQSQESLAQVADQFPLLRDVKRWQQLAGTLSGGEQQQVAMARALLMQPKLLLLDEPSMGMSVALVEENFRIVQELSQKGLGVLMVEQNVKMALSVASRGYVLQEGRIVLAGNASDMLANPVIQHAFMGEFV